MGVRFPPCPFMILVDTNFIVTCVKLKIDLFGQLREQFPCEEIATLSPVIFELEILGENKRLKMLERDATRVSLQLLEKKARIIKMQGEADDVIVKYIKKNKGIILATLDKELISRIRRKARFLTIRVGKKITLLE